MIQLEEHIFEMGWFNHQLGCRFLYAKASQAKEMEKFYQTEMSEEAAGPKWRRGGGRRWSDEGFFPSHLKMNHV